MLGLGIGVTRTKSYKTNIINLLYPYGNLQVDSNADGLADGLSASKLATKTLVNGVQTITANNENAQHYSYFNMSNYGFIPQVGDKLYLCAIMTGINGKASICIYNRRSDGLYEQSTIVVGAINGTNEFLSGELTVTSIYSTPNVILRAMITQSGGSVNFIGTNEGMSFSKMIFINKTQAFGAGNEWTKAQVDTLIQSKPYSRYY